MHLLKARKQVAAGPTEVLLFHDSFTEASLTDLESHVPDVDLWGDGWVIHNGVSWYIGAGTGYLFVNTAASNTSSIAAAVGRSEVRIEANVNLDRSGANTKWNGLRLLGSNVAAAAGDFLFCRPAGSSGTTDFRLWKRVGGVNTELVAWTCNTGIDDGSNHDLIFSYDVATGVVSIDIDAGATLDDSWTLSVDDKAFFEENIDHGIYASDPNASQNLYNDIKIYGSSVADGPLSAWTRGFYWWRDEMKKGGGTFNGHDAADLTLNPAGTDNNVYSQRSNTNVIDSVATTWEYVEINRTNNNQKMGTTADVSDYLGKHMTVSSARAWFTWEAANDNTYGGLLLRHATGTGADFPHLFFVPTGSLPTNTWTLYKQTGDTAYTSLTTFTSTYTVTDNITADPCKVNVKDYGNGYFEFEVDDENVGNFTLSGADWTAMKDKKAVGFGAAPTTSPRGLQRMHELRLYVAWL